MQAYDLDQRDRTIPIEIVWSSAALAATVPAVPLPFSDAVSFIKEQGLWWIAQNLIRDLASLNRVEMLPWDVWGMMPAPTANISDKDRTFLDRVAVLTVGGDDMIAALREIYDNPRVKASRKVFNADRKIEEELTF